MGPMRSRSSRRTVHGALRERGGMRAAAIDHPPTRAGLRVRWLRAAAVTAVGVAILIPAIVFGVETWTPGPYALMVGVPVLLVGLFALIAASFVSRAVHRYPWQTGAAQYVYNPTTGAVLATTSPDSERMVLRVYTAMMRRQGAMLALDGGEVWVATGPSGVAVVAPPPGQQLVLALRPPAGSWRERRLEQILARV